MEQKQLNLRLHRSETYQKLFDDDYMLETFGTLTPNISQRTTYYFDLWMQWRINRVKFKMDSSSSDARNDLKSLRLKEWRDFPMRNGELRFTSEESLDMSKLGGINKYTVLQKYDRLFYQTHKHI